MTILLGIVVAVTLGINPLKALAQDSQPQATAHAHAVQWLQANGRILDSTRVAVSRDDLWKRFVRCAQPEQRIGCSLIGDKPVTLVEITFDSPTSATVWVSDQYVRTARCPTGIPLPQPIISSTYGESFHMSYVKGAWREMRPGSKVAC